MNDVPLLFAESVAQLFDYDSIFSLKDSRSSLFGKVGRSLWEKQLKITLNVVYNLAAGTFDYCLTCTRKYGSFWSATPYTFNPPDYRSVCKFKVNLLKGKSSLYFMDVGVTWTTATPSDPTFLKLLGAPFARTELYLKGIYPRFLNLLPGYCTFNYICECGEFDHSEVLDAIIQRSQACRRLERVHCVEFFKKRGIKASIDWIATNKRLKWISGICITKPESVRSALSRLGVQ